MYNTVIQYLYVLWNDHNQHLSQYIFIISFIMRTCKIQSLHNFQICSAVLRTIFTMLLCCTLHPHDLFYNWKFVPLEGRAFPHPFASGNHKSVHCISELGVGFSPFLMLFLDSMYKQNHIVFVFPVQCVIYLTCQKVLWSILLFYD